MKGHADNIVGTMKQQDEMAIYFVHRDLEGGCITKDPWIEREVENGRVHEIKGPKKIFKCYGRNWERRT